MPEDVMEEWLTSGKTGVIAGKPLRPIQNTHFPGTPLSVERGQAVVYFLHEANRQTSGQADWVIKKFKQGRCPNEKYLLQAGTVLPATPAFTAGRDRLVLTSKHVNGSWGTYRTRALKRWVEGAILMQMIGGTDWAAVAEDIRDGSLILERQHRLSICRRLSGTVRSLEQAGCAHRDLSCGNVFIDMATLQVRLIDIDSLYHAKLKLPPETTCGTEGYVLPAAWQQGRQVPRLSWCPMADRFSLAILNVEMLAVGRGSPMSGDGSFFSQEDLANPQSEPLRIARNVLAQEFPGADMLLDQALTARDFSQCPSPEAWISLCCRQVALSKLSVNSMERIDADFFQRILDQHSNTTGHAQRCRGNGRGRTSSILATEIQSFVKLPPDPWKA